MNAQPKHTPGPWGIDHEDDAIIISQPGKDGSIVAILRHAAGNEEQESNARLIAEAGTVANETGLTPRQLADALKEEKFERQQVCAALTREVIKTEKLADQRAELLEALDRLVFDLGDLRAAMTNYTPNTAAEIGRAMNRARAAIAKATGEQP